MERGKRTFFPCSFPIYKWKNYRKSVEGNWYPPAAAGVSSWQQKIPTEISRYFSASMLMNWGAVWVKNTTHTPYTGRSRVPGAQPRAGGGAGRLGSCELKTAAQGKASRDNGKACSWVYLVSWILWGTGWTLCVPGSLCYSMTHTWQEPRACTCH